MSVSRYVVETVWRRLVGTAARCSVALGCLMATSAAAEPPLACSRVPIPAFCGDARNESSTVCPASWSSGEFSTSEGDLADRLTVLGTKLETVQVLADRLNAGTLIGCRLLSLGARGPARRALNTALNATVRVMESEGRSDGAAEALIELAQVQFAAGFDADAIRALAAFDWAVGDMSMAEESARILAMAGLRMAEVDRLGLAGRMFADAWAMAARTGSDRTAVMRNIATLEAKAGL